MNYLENGHVEYNLWVSKGGSSPGCIPGEIFEGEWHIQFDISKVKFPVEIYIRVYIDENEDERSIIYPFIEKRIIRDQPGWYCGELHSHSIESDGDLSVNQLIQRASLSNLDFLSITDHFTISQWWKIDDSSLSKILIINSLEITSQKGHANIHGINKWVNVFIDDNEWTANDAAIETHIQEGLLCINHAFSGDLGWRHFNFDWNHADLIEIYHSLEGPNNDAQIGLWDSLLRQGYRIIGVAGTDCHNPDNENERLGRLVTWVFGNNLSQKEIINGLKKGRVYISLGPLFDFHIENSESSVVCMGESIDSKGKSLKLNIDLCSKKRLRLFLIKNGFILETKIIDSTNGEFRSITFIDKKPNKGYYRIELHDVIDNPTYSGIEWRDFSSVQVLSNPIWVK